MREAEKSNYIWTRIRLGNSMILTGENHSQQSLEVLAKAKAELQRFEDLEAENKQLRDANRWILVEERLPTSDGNKDVILVNAEGYRWQTVVWFENARFVLQSGEEVEFWSERRPEPYQGDL